MSDKETTARVLEALAFVDYAHIREQFWHLASNPPQVLLLEGGTEIARRAFARFWACCLLCTTPNNGPCLSCQECQRVLNDIHYDILAFDGGITKTQDEEEPGFFRALSAASARGLRDKLRDAPSAQYRVVYLTGIAKSKAEAPNALLKLLEDPQPSTRFILLVPQREQILPTLVSRSLCLTLPWQLHEDSSDNVRDLLNSLAAFLQDKDNFLGTIALKNALPVELARDLVHACQMSLVRILEKKPTCAFDTTLLPLSPENLLLVMNWLREAEDMLRSQASPVSPVRVLSSLAMRLHLLCNTIR